MANENDAVGAQHMANFIGISVGLLALFAWFQHLYTCFTEESWGFLVAGAIFFPVAMIHGIGIWLGFW